MFRKPAPQSEPRLDPALAHALAQRYRDEVADKPLTRCLHCGGYHTISCPRVKAIEFQGEEPRRVEFWAWDEWPHELVMFPDEILAAAEEDA